MFKITMAQVKSLATGAVLLAWTGCQTATTAVDKDVDAEPYPHWDSGGTPTDSPSDSHIPNDTSEPQTPVDEWVELTETWRDCRGSLQLMDSSFTWTDADPSCIITGSAQLDDDGLTIVVDTIGECDSIPWWIDTTDPAVYGVEVVGERLTLIPQDPRESGSAKQLLVKQFAKGDVDRQRWEMISSDGDTSNLDICFLPEGPFYTGQYYSTDDSCNFLSCGGAVTGALQTDDSLTLYTACAGNCPCVGMLFSEDVEKKSFRACGPAATVPEPWPVNLPPPRWNPFQRFMRRHCDHHLYRIALVHLHPSSRGEF